MFGQGTEAELAASIIRAGLPAVIDFVCGLVGQRVVVLQTEPISDDPVKRMDAAREALRMRFVHDSQPPAAAPSPKAESVPSPPATDPYDEE